MMTSKKENKPSKRQELRKHIEHNMVTRTTVWQDRPYTAVRCEATFGSASCCVYGFSKVNWPDAWDPQEGINKAEKRAVAKAVRYFLKMLYGIDPGTQIYQKFWLKETTNAS